MYDICILILYLHIKIVRNSMRLSLCVKIKDLRNVYRGILNIWTWMYLRSPLCDCVYKEYFRYHIVYEYNVINIVSIDHVMYYISISALLALIFTYY